jgi:methionine synthase I (cobalamin-dependent)/5,10-methylenetetrahydrofolate reductase
MSQTIRQFLEAPGVVVFDGAMGTMLFQYGIFINRCFDEANLTNPELVLRIHKEYLDAGADVIETNTFGAGRFKLQAFGLADRAEAINLKGAELARDAAGKEGFVAGSVGPLGVRIEPFGPTSQEEAFAAFVEHVSALVKGGVDMISLETFTDLAEIKQALEAVKRVSEETGKDIPVLASMTVDNSGNSLFGTEPEFFGPKLESLGADIVGINCSVGPKTTLDAIERMAKTTNIPLAAMPNAGLPTEVEGRRIYLTSPDYMAGYARRFADAGVKIVGGCCGTTPEHIRVIVASIRQRTGEQRSLASRRAAIEVPVETPVQEIPLEERSQLARKLSNGELIASIELAPPQGWQLEKVKKSARKAKAAGFDAVNIPDGPRASARLGALAMAAVLEQSVEMETIMHYACRDRNLVGMQSDLLGAYAIGLRNVLAITGDPPILGDYPQATAVFDVDAIGLVNMLSRLNRGVDLGGRRIGNPTGFFSFVALNPTAINPEKELERFGLKVEAGANAAITQPVFDAEQLLGFLEKTRLIADIPIMAGIWPMQSLRNAEFLANEVPGVSIPKALIERMAAAKERDEERSEGEKIAVEILTAVLDEVQGIQVAAPFGRIQSAITVLDAARALVARAKV